MDWRSKDIIYATLALPEVAESLVAAGATLTPLNPAMPDFGRYRIRGSRSSECCVRPRLPNREFP